MCACTIFWENQNKRNPFIKCSDSNIRITPSLTHHRLELLNLAQSYLQEEYYNKKDDICPKFTFADVHGNLKLVLNQPFKNRSVFSFSSVCEFHQIINKVTTQSSYPYEDDDDGAEWLKLVVNVEGRIGHSLTPWCWNAARITLPVFLEVYLSSMVLSQSFKVVWWVCIFIVSGGNMVSSEQHHWCWSDTILAVWWWVVSHHIIIIILQTILHLLHLSVIRSQGI